MKTTTLKSLTNAHAWIGLIISTVLFIIFFAGSISLFRENVLSWEHTPPLAKEIGQFNYGFVDYDKAISSIQNSYNVEVDHGFYLFPPTEYTPYIEAYFAEVIDDTDPETGEDHHDVHVYLNPNNGEIIGNGENFQFANFIYQLHYNLGLGRIGLYFVGLITLFFFVALLTGTVIHWRKLVKNFFQYRSEGKKDKWLDAITLSELWGCLSTSCMPSQGWCLIWLLFTKFPTLYFFIRVIRSDYSKQQDLTNHTLKNLVTLSPCQG
ncbi:hypothetical protein CS022_00960 [Veronia nyctiphanis]|uniref:PepSY domain-containing protein n=1 Tax=Veronia nyctiphanis TaxID=1278244 RepID=A0A4Q0YU51_9GAMM|nr:hypothetical protein CS022_00960 [Veronia nyctiphanis]